VIDKLLIANRGEIACRIARTCRRLGIRTVAVFSEADRNARHVRLADEAVAIGPPPAADSYLQIPRILEAMRRTGADAVHPGYGFLAESPAFAEAVRAAGLVFVGPSPEAMARLGGKDTAKEVAEAAGVPLVPGYRGADQSDARLAAEAAAIGFPLLVKAVAGGGGKGMRRVDRPADLAEALAACRREARAAFGDERVLLERLIERPRHIEVQVLGDRHGTVLHLLERDCTLQRRHQKILEEAPAPDLPEPLRAALADAAVRLARAAGYEGAGTVEFLLAPDGSFAFIEMNTRLQVEHPVTEAVTGLDLVALQLEVAAGRPLKLRQEAIRADGHAVEARLYAEDPARGFLPSTGRLERLVLPLGLPGVRVDTGVEEGDTVTAFYDPMIAKIVAHGADRATALARLERALEASLVLGPATNLAFLRRAVAAPAFRDLAIDVTWLDREGAELARAEEEPSPLELAAAALLVAEADRAAALAGAGPRAGSPWLTLDGFRLAAPARRAVRLEAAGRERLVELLGPRERPEVRLDGRTLGVLAHGSDEAGPWLEADGRRLRLAAALAGERIELVLDGRRVQLRRAAEAGGAAAELGAEGMLTAPMPGKVARLLVAPGETVARGQPLAVLEAMKMEHRLLAPRDGRVGAVHVGEGEQVEEGTLLLDLVEPAAEGG
jgi:3-methylcrotonyl-CoA carboxylase alpha subunit